MNSRLSAPSAPDGLGASYGTLRRAFIKRRFRCEPWVKVLDALLVVLVAGDFANLFLAVESATRSGYVVIIAITVTLTLLCVMLPFLAGKFWRKRAGGSRESTYLLVAVLTLGWIALVVFITLLRLRTEGVIPSSIGSTAAGGGSAIASLGTASTSLRPGSGQALTWLLTVMLLASGTVAFTSAWAAADPVRTSRRRLEMERLNLIEARERLVALSEEYRHAEGFFEQLIDGDTERYHAMQMQSSHHAELLKSRVRARMIEQLGDPASTTALSQPGGQTGGYISGYASEQGDRQGDRQGDQRTDRQTDRQTQQQTSERSTDEHEHSPEQLPLLDPLFNQGPAADGTAKRRGAA
jgi:hypothetical protein